MIKEIEPSKILETAMRIVSGAQKNIQMTMQAKEEVLHPLPQEYFELLQKKMREGTKVTRIGFGSEEEFEKIRDNVYLENQNYTFYRTDSSDYRRMLLVDDKKLMFAKTDKTGRHVFYTQESSDIEKYREYLSSHWPQSESS